MAAVGKPRRPWDIDDLLDLGKRGGITYMKAIPVLILEKWEREQRQEGVANYFRTKDLARRLESSKLVAGFKSKGTSNVGSGLVKMQNARNLINPPLVRYEGGGVFWVNLPSYEVLLQEYRQIYRTRYSKYYTMLFPEEESERERQEKERAKTHDEINNLLTPLEQALRERQQAIERLTEENRDLQDERATLQASARLIADDELRKDCEEFLKRKDTCIDAIRRAGVVLEERLKRTIGGDGEEKFKYGLDLVDYALRKGSGKLVLSENPAEQEGVHMLFRGAVQFVRNPPSHKKLKYDELEARQAVSLIDYLLSLLRQIKTN